MTTEILMSNKLNSFNSTTHNNSNLDLKCDNQSIHSCCSNNKAISPNNEELILKCFFLWESQTLYKQLHFSSVSHFFSSTSEILYESVFNLFGIPQSLQSLRFNGVFVESSDVSLSYLIRPSILPLLSQERNFAIQTEKPATEKCIPSEKLTNENQQRQIHKVQQIDKQGFFLEQEEEQFLLLRSFLSCTHWNVRVSSKLVGGKGGFGTLLKGQRGAKRKTKNFDACRDLSGRRIRRAKAVERLTEWLDKRDRDNELVRLLGGGAGEDGVVKEEMSSKKDAIDRSDQILKNRLVNQQQQQSSATSYLGGLNATLKKTENTMNRFPIERRSADLNV